MEGSLTHRFVEAAQQAGFPFNPDLNGKQRSGVGYSQMTRRGRFRGSTAQTFLRQARGRANLRIETGALATRIKFNGRRCIGVSFRQGGVERTAFARDWNAARAVLVAHLRFVRDEVRRWRRRPWLWRLMRPGRALINDHPLWTVLGVLLGCLLLVSLGPACQFLDVPTTWQRTLVGVVTVAAVLVDSRWRGRQA